MAQNAVSSLSPQRAAEKQKYYTLGHQKKKQRLHSDFLTVSKGMTNNPKSRVLMQVLFNQGAEKSSTSDEAGGAGESQAQLDVLKQTLQSFPTPSELCWRWGEGGKEDVLENSWTDIVHSHKSMSKTQRHQQEALWEFFHTEILYINQLTNIHNIVLGALDYLHHHGFLQEITAAQLFSNLSSIIDAHKLFWQEVMYPMLQDVRQTGMPFDPLKLEPGCLQFFERFSAYFDYCWEEERNMDFARRLSETNSYFYIFALWVETHPHCGRMRLGDMQAKPHQRITKYPLLLKAILKTTQDTHTQEKLNHMLNNVRQFLVSINDHLHFKNDELALLILSQRIEGYEMKGMSEEIDKYMQDFCCFDLTNPIRGAGPRDIRKLLMNETLKVRGKKDSKLEVMLLLFTDVLLLTKVQKKSEKQKVVRPPLSLERLHCAHLKDGNSFVLVEASDLGCALSVYSVFAPSQESCTAWVSTIHQAQESLDDLRKKAIINSKVMSDQLEESTVFLSEDKEEQSEWDNATEHNMETSDKSEGSEIYENGQWNNSGVFFGRGPERRVTWNHSPKSQKNTDVSQKSTEVNSNCSYSFSEEVVDNNKPNESSSSKCQGSWSQRSEDLRGSLIYMENYPSNTLSSNRSEDSEEISGKKELLTLQPNSGSSSSSNLNGSYNQHRPPSSSTKSQDSHLVLKLGSLRQNRGVLWNDHLDALSPVSQDNYKTAISPETQFKNSNSLSLLNTLQPQASALPPLSPLHCLLIRAQERDRERGLAKKEETFVKNTDSLVNHPVADSTSSLPKREQETEKELELFKPNLNYYPYRWRESSVDGNDIESSDRPSTPLGANVDWPGWCFDDEDGLEYWGRNDESADGCEQLLTRTELQQTHDDGEYSEV